MRLCGNQPVEVWETEEECDLASEALAQVLDLFITLEEQGATMEAVKLVYNESGWTGTLYVGWIA